MQTSFSTANGYAPKAGPQIIPITLDFTSVATIAMDLMQEEAEGFIEFIQGIFIDNSANANPFKITFAVTGQMLAVPAKWQAYLPVLTTPQCTFKAQTTAGVKVPITLYNMPMPAFAWNTGL